MAKTVKVKLHARCWVHDEVREKGDIVELPELADDGEPLAAVFGEIVGEVADEPAQPPITEPDDPEAFS
jgi:hypothetical protein